MVTVCKKLYEKNLLIKIENKIKKLVLLKFIKVDTSAHQGFGYSTPKTVGGKVFCMFYALVGIPLNLIMFQSIGERLNIFVTFVLRHFKKCFRFKSSEVSQTNLIFVCINMSSIVVAGGAYAFSRIEGWSYLDAFYYCIITLTTIGFGDYVALQRNEDLQHKPQYFIFSLLFILFGLAILSAAMNLLVLRFLTLNTEDERKDELEALAAIRSAVRLDGDVITSNNSLLSPYLFNHRPTSFVNQSTNAYFPAQLPSRSPLQPIESMHSTSMEQPMIGMVDQDRVSVCSCTCYNFKNNLRKRSKKGSIFQTISHSLSSRQSRGESTAANSFIAQLLQPVKVLQAMSQVHANKNNEDWRVQNTVFGQRRNSA